MNSLNSVSQSSYTQQFLQNYINGEPMKTALPHGKSAELPDCFPTVLLHDYYSHYRNAGNFYSVAEDYGNTLYPMFCRVSDIFANSRDKNYQDDSNHVIGRIRFLNESPYQLKLSGLGDSVGPQIYISNNKVLKGFYGGGMYLFMPPLQSTTLNPGDGIIFHVDTTEPYHTTLSTANLILKAEVSDLTTNSILGNVKIEFVAPSNEQSLHAFDFRMCEYKEEKGNGVNGPFTLYNCLSDSKLISGTKLSNNNIESTLFGKYAIYDYTPPPQESFWEEIFKPFMEITNLVLCVGDLATLGADSPAFEEVSNTLTYIQAVTTTIDKKTPLTAPDKDIAYELMNKATNGGFSLGTWTKFGWNIFQTSEAIAHHHYFKATLDVAKIALGGPCIESFLDLTGLDEKSSGDSGSYLGGC